MANATATYTTRLQKKYIDEVVPALMKKFGYKTVMASAASGENLPQSGRERLRER